MKLKKKKGEIPESGYVIIFGILALFIMIVAANGSFKASLDYMDANNIANKYMLRMESYGHGYLTQDDSSSLISDLEKAGFSNVDLSGSTFTEVLNGGQIYLDIKYDQKISQLSMQNFNVKFGYVTKRVEIPLSSTSKN